MIQFLAPVLALIFGVSVLAYFSSSFSLMLVGFAILSLLFVLPKDARFDNIRFYLITASLGIFAFLGINAIAKLGVETLLNTLSDITNTILVYLFDNPLILVTIGALIFLAVYLSKKVKKNKRKGVYYATTRPYRVSTKNK
jgi:hypothetical protein